ncbi:hypothetical protein WJX72_007424 [[Myrmecia] bisecta]|uniref:Uncharacterized protein n=1 Tax=[Myrmecia] bisecta TaxID=41462 RepID=A0AAW1R7U3_9CHLO
MTESGQALTSSPVMTHHTIFSRQQRLPGRASEDSMPLSTSSSLSSTTLCERPAALTPFALPEAQRVVAPFVVDSNTAEGRLVSVPSPAGTASSTWSYGEGMLYAQLTEELRSEAAAALLQSDSASTRPDLERHSTDRSLGSEALSIHNSKQAPGNNAGQGRSEAEVMAQVEKATAVIDAMMDEIAKQLFTDEFASEISGEAVEVTEREAVRAAVSKRIDDLDEAFLLALNAYLGGAEQQGNALLAGRLAAIQQEVLREVSKRLPVEMQVLDQLLRLDSSEERTAMAKVAAQGGEGDIPACDISRLQACASQFVDDMEEQEVIPSRKLLAKLCIVCEEIQNANRELNWNSQGTNSTDSLALMHKMVPKGAAAFLKELMAVSHGPKRLALLQKTFREDWAGAGSSKRADAVRPGRFLLCVNATQAELLKAGSGAAEAQLERLEDIRREALQVLEAIATVEQ